MARRLLSAAVGEPDRPSAPQWATPGPGVWLALPPERRAAVVTLLAMLAARAAGGGYDEPGRVRPGGQPQQKIRPDHLDRAAVVYVRQSTRHQVLEHTESTRLQYALGERALALGWARSQVTVIDDDLGVSAAAADSRKGFARLVTEVTMGRVGVVLGIEMSRLARTGRDWHQLLELCSLSGVLLADPNGVYDPQAYSERPAAAGPEGNDERGGTVPDPAADAAGKLAKAERGELPPAADRLRPPPSGEATFDPDEQAHTSSASSSAPSPARNAQQRAPLPGGPGGPVAGPGPTGPARGSSMAAPDPGDAAEHAAQPGLRRVLRLRPPPGRPAPEDPGPPGHRPGGEGRR